MTVTTLVVSVAYWVATTHKEKPMVLPQSVPIDVHQQLSGYTFTHTPVPVRVRECVPGKLLMNIDGDTLGQYHRLLFVGGSDPVSHTDHQSSDGQCATHHPSNQVLVPNFSLSYAGRSHESSTTSARVSRHALPFRVGRAEGRGFNPAAKRLPTFYSSRAPRSSPRRAAWGAR